MAKKDTQISDDLKDRIDLIAKVAKDSGITVQDFRDSLDIINEINEQVSDNAINKVFALSVITPYSEEEIRSFMYLTGFSIYDTKDVLILFKKAGIPNLDVVIKLAKLGYFKTK